jgi:hypothetical protein
MSVKGALPLALCSALACAEPAVVGSGAGSSRPVLEENELVGMIPAEASLVLWADVAKLRASPWTRDSFAAVASGEASAAESNFAAIRDVDLVVFAKVPTLREGASLLLAHGKIDRERMSGAFAERHASFDSTSYRGAELLAGGEEALAFVGKRTAVSGLTVAVRAALDCNFGVARTIESESWFVRMRRELQRGRDERSRVAELYVLLQPATREALLHEMGEGGELEEFGSRIDLDADLDATAIGVVASETEARDMAARLAERLRDARTRPIVDAFGFGSVLDGIRLEAKAARVYGTLHVSETQRAEIAQRMARVAETMATMRKREEKKNP